MGRSPCCEKVGLKKGPWTSEEDQKLLTYIEEHGHGSWRALPAKAGLRRCGKSCRLRWTNYLRPDIKRGKFNSQEEQTIIQLHALLGNRWSAIATYLPKRTDNEIKNYWNTHLKKRLVKMGIDPVTHKPKSDALTTVNGEPKNAANLSHMAQWESARLEAEARLVRESKLRSNSIFFSGSAQVKTAAAPSSAQSSCLDVLEAWQELWSKSMNSATLSGVFGGGGGADLESPTPTLRFSENSQPITIGFGEGSSNAIDYFGNSTAFEGGITIIKEEGEYWKSFEKSSDLPVFRDRMENSMIYNDMGFAGDCEWISESLKSGHGQEGPGSNFMEGYGGDLLLSNSDERNSSECVGDSENGDGSCGDDFEVENNTDWISILNLVNSSPLKAPVV